jgi:hypothetical protein
MNLSSLNASNNFFMVKNSFNTRTGEKIREKRCRQGNYLLYCITDKKNEPIVFMLKTG